MKNTCETCGHNRETTEPLGWDELNCFTIAMFPDTLTVITNAEQEDVEKALATIGERHANGEGCNLDALLQEQGFVCLISGTELVEIFC
jgi:hypothetical protein